jgi:hypothetical protein
MTDLDAQQSRTPNCEGSAEGHHQKSKQLLSEIIRIGVRDRDHSVAEILRMSFGFFGAFDFIPKPCPRAALASIPTSLVRLRIAREPIPSNRGDPVGGLTPSYRASP